MQAQVVFQLEQVLNNIFDYLEGTLKQEMEEARNSIVEKMQWVTDESDTHFLIQSKFFLEN